MWSQAFVCVSYGCCRGGWGVAGSHGAGSLMTSDRSSLYLLALKWVQKPDTSLGRLERLLVTAEQAQTLGGKAMLELFKCNNSCFVLICSKSFIAAVDYWLNKHEKLCLTGPGLSQKQYVFHEHLGWKTKPKILISVSSIWWSSLCVFCVGRTGRQCDLCSALDLFSAWSCKPAVIFVFALQKW